MLDPWIIEEILRREDDRHREEERGRAELPLEFPLYRDGVPFQPDNKDSDTGRGVTIIDI